jgi:hypothetical protein
MESNWISVDDQLPVIADDVLAYSPDEGCFRAWYDNDLWFTHENGNKAAPTHWMYLPEPPRAQVTNGPSSFGMTENLVASESRPFSVWSESVETAKDIRRAWEQRFGGPYKIVKSTRGYKVLYVGEWRESKPALTSR